MAKCTACPYRRLCRDECYGENPCAFAKAFDTLTAKVKRLKAENKGLKEQTTAATYPSFKEPPANVREILVELINSTGTCGLTSIEDCKFCDYSKEINCRTAAVADHLISHGVTFERHGRWIFKWDADKDPKRLFVRIVCSECNLHTGQKSNYCPHCGAEMDK